MRGANWGGLVNAVATRLRVKSTIHQIPTAAVPPRLGAVRLTAPREASGWNVEGNEVRHNHGMGIRSGNGMWIHGNKVHDNGQLGLGGGGS